MKKALATILALVMALGLTTAAWADEATQITAETTVLNSGSYIVNGEVALTNGALTVNSGATVTLELAAGSS